MKKKEYKSLVASIGVAIALFAILFIWLGPEKVWNALMNANPKYLALALLVEIVDIYFLNIRWHVFVKPVVPSITVKDTLAISLGGVAVSNITPGGRVGGEAIKAYLMNRVWGISYSASFATIIVERIIDMLAFLIISGVAILYGILFVHLPLRVIILLGIVFLFSASVMLGLWYVTLKKRIKSSWIERLINKHKWIMKHIPVLNYYEEKLSQYLNDYYTHVSKIAVETNVMVKGFIYSMIYWFLEIFRAYVIFLALGAQPSLPVIALAYVLSTVIGSLPIGVGGVGLTEGTMILIYSASNINTVVASLETMIDRLLSYWLLILIGLPIAGYLGIKPKEEIENGRLHDSTGKRPKEG